jgi:hypothetical protein
MTASPNDLDLLGMKIDAEDKLEYARKQLLEEPEMVLTMDEKGHTPTPIGRIKTMSRSS